MTYYLILMKVILDNKGVNMANNERGQKGFVSIENCWSNKIKSIIVMHSADNIEKTEGLLII